MTSKALLTSTTTVWSEGGRAPSSSGRVCSMIPRLSSGKEYCGEFQVLQFQLIWVRQLVEWWL
jgi:hypothetical protein